MLSDLPTLVILLLLAGAVLLGLRWGRTRERRKGDEALQGAFAEGFLAGHLQGWRDGQSAIGKLATDSTAPDAAQSAVPAAAQPPAPTAPAAAQAPAPALAPGQPPAPTAPTAAAQLPIPQAGAPTPSAPKPPAITRPQVPPFRGSPQLPAFPATGFRQVRARPPVQHRPSQHPPVPASPVPAALPPSQYRTVRYQQVQYPAQPAPIRWAAPQPPPPRQAAVPPESPQQRAARKEKRDRQNINITLYVASLLLVAAGALFVGTSLPEGLRFAGVAAITVLFYAGGLILHAKAPRLRPAAVAFAGTGLALVPVSGLALYNFTLHDGPAAWLVTSVIGTVAYVAAAVRMDSRVLAYLSLTFIVSTTWSGVSVLGGALVWYFVAMIVLAILLTLLALTRPRWVPPVFLNPLRDLHPFVVPSVAVAVTFVPLLLGRGEYALIMFLCGAYFALMAAIPQSRFRVGQYYAARVSLTVAAAAGVWAATESLSWSLLATILLASLQAVAVGWWRDAAPATLLLGAAGRRGADALATFGLQLFLTFLWSVAVRFDAPALDVPVWMPLLLALLTGMVLAVRQGGLAEWAPAAALLLYAGTGDGGWGPAGFLLLATLFWTGRALPAAEPLRRHFVLAARIAPTLAVPAAVAALTDDSSTRIPVLSALLLALVAQQLVTAFLARTGVPTLAPGASLAAFTLAVVPVLIALLLVDDTPGRNLSAAAIVLQLLVSLAIGMVLAGGARAVSPWRPGVPELLPLAMAAALAGMAFTGISLRTGNTVLVLTALYLVLTAWRRSALQQRWSYWWVARGTGTLLVLTGFQQFRQDNGPLLLGGEELTGAWLVLLALTLQLAFPLLAEARGRVPRGLLADAAAVLALQAGALAVLRIPSLQDDGSGSWQLTAASVLMALSAAAAGFVLRARPQSVVFAPAALAVLLLFRAGSALDLELVLGIFAVFCAVMVVAADARIAKGAYFAAARVLTLALALVLSYDATVSVTAVSVTFGLVLAAQHVIRWLMRHRLLEVPFQQAAVWITLAAQTVLPLGYLAAAPDDGGRWVLLLHLALLLVSAAVASRVFAARGAAYLTVYAAVFASVALGPLAEFDGGPSSGGFLGRPLLSRDGVVALLLVLAVVATGAGLRFRRTARPDVERWLWLAAAGAFVVAALLLAPRAADWLTGAAVLVLAVVLFAASHLERWPVLYVPAVLSVLAGATREAGDLLDTVPGAWGSYLPLLAGCAPAAAMLYAVRWLRHSPLRADPVRRLSLAAAAVLGLGFTAAAGLRWDATSWAGAVLVAATAAVCCAEAPAAARRLAAELGLLATTAAVQRALLFTGSGRPDWFWILQWYVVLAAVLGALRLASGYRPAGRVLWAVGAGLLTLSGLGIIFGGDAGQQLWVLALLAVLLMAGLAVGDRLFVWWGAAGVALSILWAMRQYTFALLALIAAALIAIAVWRLNRSKPAEPGAAPAPEREPADHG